MSFKDTRLRLEFQDISFLNSSFMKFMMVYCSLLITLELIDSGLVLDFLTFLGIPLPYQEVNSLELCQVI